MASQTGAAEKEQPDKAPTQDVLPLQQCVSLADLEQVARVKLSPMALAYYSTAAETHGAFDHNHRDWRRIGLRPRVLRNVTKVTMRTRIMASKDKGPNSSLPIFISPAAAAGLGHPDGERCLARGAARMDIPQCVCTAASVPPRQIMAAFRADPLRRGGVLFFQLYVPKVKRNAAKLIAMAKAAGFEALIVTVDTPVIGKRDADDRFRRPADVPQDGELLPPLPGDEPGPLRGYHDTTLVWEDLDWIRSLWGADKPIIVKGIQTVEDALQATRHGAVDAIYLSNHGGRQLDHAPSAVQTLLAIREQHPEILEQTEIYLDGGVRRGTDVVKALCLGARAVGLGRGFLYALSAYGTDGVVRAIQILSEEIQTAMRLLGVTDVSQLNDSYLDLSEFAYQRAKI
ncbi:Cytochrome b2 [Pleurostoma richardsiae]|uniref:Cytochrome b2 n=1 Tax=Pleurostoma richardsiae TaxID=41990 RepID=A0AA38RBQ2_9PEZI|nr:Cytochrome b2 [Pleurostoma richardsiae]